MQNMWVRRFGGIPTGSAGALDVSWWRVGHWKMLMTMELIIRSFLIYLVFNGIEARDLISRKDVVDLFGREQSLEWGNMDDIENCVSVVFKKDLFGELFCDGPYLGALRYSSGGKTL